MDQPSAIVLHGMWADECVWCDPELCYLQHCAIPSDFGIIRLKQKSCLLPGWEVRNEWTQVATWPLHLLSFETNWNTGRDQFGTEWRKMERITIEGIALHLSDKEEVMQQGDNPDHAAITTKVFYLDSNMSKQWNVENWLSQPPDLRKKKTVCFSLTKTRLKLIMAAVQTWHSITWRSASCRLREWFRTKCKTPNQFLSGPPRTLLLALKPL